jgi:hypothetical protein
MSQLVRKIKITWRPYREEATEGDAVYKGAQGSGGGRMPIASTLAAISYLVGPKGSWRRSPDEAGPRVRPRVFGGW